MYPVTEAVAALFDANQPQVLRITGADPNGVAINITEANVMSGGFSIDRYCNNGAKLELGTAVSAELTLKLNNADGTFDGIMFEGAELFVEIGIADWTQTSPTVTWIPCGYFTPDEQPRNRTIITVSALDRMMNFDTTIPTLSPWTTESGETMRDQLGNILYFCADLVFPATVSSLVEQVCARCNVPLTQDISTLPNASFVVQEAPKLQQDSTFRNIIQWCAGIMGTNAIIDYNGELQFLWYGSSGYNTTPDRRYSSDLYENDITVTGVTYTDANQQTYLAGSDSYALDISNNYLLTDLDDTSISAVLTAIYATLTGFTYRPFEAKVMPAPWLWPMDRITFTDLQGNTHISLLTNVNTTINGATVLKGSGETSQANSYAAPSGLTAAQTQALRRILQSSNEQIEAAIADATNQITGATNSNVKFVYNEQGGLSEILVMDSPDIETAVNVWRWNRGGLGHSSNGYNGPYSLAMTQDGSIVASMITSGVLNATLMKAGIIQDTAGLNYWNMDTGEFVLSGSTQVGTTTLGDVASAASAAIISVDVEYAQNQSTTTAPTSGWSTTAPAWAEGCYIWQRTATTTPSGTTYSTPTCISGRDGVDGTSVTILGSYSTLADLQAAHPTGSAGDSYMVGADLYVWNGSAWEDVGQIQGPQGPQGPIGNTGAAGADGVGISSIFEQYYLSTSSHSPTGGSWSFDQPQWVSGKYIWTRSRIVWTNGSTSNTSPVLATALNGANQTAADAQAAVTTLDNSLTQQDIFNRLTNNGQVQGIYLQNGKIYINGSYIAAGQIDGDLITAGVITGRKQDGTSHVYKTEYDLVNAKLIVSNIYYTDQTQQTVDYQWSTVFEDGGISFYYNGTKIGYITAAEVNGNAQIRLYGSEIQVVAPSTSYDAEVTVTDDTVQIRAADIELYADNTIRYNGSALYTGLISIDGQYLDVENGLIRSFS